MTVFWEQHRHATVDGNTCCLPLHHNLRVENYGNNNNNYISNFFIHEKKIMYIFYIILYYINYNFIISFGYS